MFSGPGWAYCVQSRQLLEARGLAYSEYDVSDPQHMEEYRARRPRTSSLPQIFIHGDHSGSFTDLQLLADSGQLPQ